MLSDGGIRVGGDFGVECGLCLLYGFPDDIFEVWLYLVSGLKRVVVFSVGEQFLPVDIIRMHALGVDVFSCKSFFEELSYVSVNLCHVS